jgi:hypothetical protein
MDGRTEGKTDVQTNRWMYRHKQISRQTIRWIDRQIWTDR